MLSIKLYSRMSIEKSDIQFGEKMVKVLILYFLNIKQTHGYEIQKFIQTSGFDTWANIKTGSIYYALNKMEKDGEIELVREEIRGSRTRRIYKITELGREVLKKTIEEELKGPIVPLNLGKFILPATFNKINKQSAVEIIEKRIGELNKEIEFWKYWREVKANASSGATFHKADKISFDMAISNFEYELQWYRALIEEFDIYYEFSKKYEIMIKNVDFEEVDQKDTAGIDIEKASIGDLKSIILNNSEAAEAALNKLITMIQKEK